VHNAAEKALEEAARTSANAVKEKERVQGEFDIMTARLRAVEQVSGVRQTPIKQKPSNGARRTKKVMFCDPITGCEKIRDALLCRNCRIARLTRGTTVLQG
jgi:hypothetical protein